MGYLTTDKKKITAKTFIEMKQAGEKITQLTAYDYTTAGIIDAAGIDSPITTRTNSGTFSI